MRIRSSWGGSPNIRAVQGAVSNARGRDFEDYLDRACQLYRSMGIANIEKTPEPFKCLKKNKGGRAIVQFIHHAQPDYKGVLLNGQAIIFEAKCTTKDRIQQSVLTQNQADMLRDYQRLGAYTAVCVGIQDEYFFVPFRYFDNMGEFFGHKYATADNLKPWKVPFNGSAVFFLDNLYNVAKIRAKP